MKKILYQFGFQILISFLTISSCAQKKSGLFPYQDGKIYFSEVVQLDSSFTMEILYDNSLLVLNNAAKKYNNQITNKQTWGLSDFIVLNKKDSGEVIGVSRVLAEQSLNSIILSFDVYIYSKEGKYKFVLTNFNILGSSLGNAIAGRNINVNNPLEPGDTKVNGFTKAVDKAIKNYITDLKAQMEKKKPSKDF